MKSAAKTDDFQAQLRRKEWVIRQRKSRQRSLLLSTLSQCPNASEVIAGITDDDDDDDALFTGSGQATRTALTRAVRRLSIADGIGGNGIRRAVERPTRSCSRLAGL